MSRKIFCLGIKAFIIILSLIFISTAKSQETATEKPSGSTKVLELLVINKATKEPIPEVELAVRFAELVQNGREEIDNYKTDSNGQCKINLEGKPRDYVRIVTAKDSYVPSRVIWSKSSTVQQVPSQYTLTMIPGTRIGGKVQNEQGEPIEGVIVGIYLRKEYIGPEASLTITLFPYEEKVKTDSNGYWEYDKLPDDFKAEELRIFLEHPDYISDNLIPGLIPQAITPLPPLSQLRDMSSIMKMKSGVLLSGRVLDSDGRPIQNALVSEAIDRFERTYPDARTDKEGNFFYKSATAGKFTLAVQAKGYSPDTLEVDVQSGISPVEFRLEPGHKVTGKIVDKDGKPIAGATIGIQSWRGTEVLDWSTVTNAEGYFHWDEAPADEALCYIQSREYMGLNNYLIIGSDNDLVITMPPPLKIHGKVVDAQTGQIIPEFKMISGRQWESDQSIYWDRDKSKAFTDGNYESVTISPYFGHYIQIEAEGYLSAVSRIFQSDEGDVVCDLKLQKAEGLSGVVLLPDEKPAEGAEVVLCAPADTMYLIQDRDSRKRNTPNYVTKEDGKFSFPAQTDKYIIFVFHKDGYAKIPYNEFEASSKIVLEPYTTLRGNFLIKNESKDGQQIYLTYENPDDLMDIRIAQEYYDETDYDGNFEFNHIPPGQAIVYWKNKNAALGSLSHGISLDIKSGQINNISIGGKGRPVIGKILIPDFIINLIDWKYSDAMLLINSANNPYTQIAVAIKKDGTINIGDVPSGDYTLLFNAYECPENGSYYPTKLLARLMYSFHVPEMPEGGSDEPLDIGELEVGVQNKESYIPSLIDKALPDLNDFNIKQVDGKKMLICFFDIEQRPSRNCVIQLSQKTQELKEKEIEVHLIHTTKVEKERLDGWLKENNISFTFGMIEDKEEQTKFNWGVKALPWLILTDKEHVVQAEGFSLNELDENIKIQ
ncbi:MAG: carboxypeptidase regulatory-like domain-containing protein [Sedimentisphaerales bacterium]|nr:carboxypeptidase regulatory-like domain-containing protein [Sedimentisphaerales bacterium]